MDFLTKELVFPDCNQADEDGILAVGGDLSVARLLLAYQSGIFPWFNEGEPIIWWAPNERMVLFPNELRFSKSMKVLFKKEVFKVTYNTCFAEVMKNCAQIKRFGQEDTWITDKMQEAYINLHKIGIAQSVEVWENDKLVGGLYGIDLKDKKIFCGESMFSKVSNASKYAFISLVQKLKNEQYKLIDCQVYNAHLDSLGAREISRSMFLKILMP